MMPARTRTCCAKRVDELSNELYSKVNEISSLEKKITVLMGVNDQNNLLDSRVEEQHSVLPTTREKNHNGQAPAREAPVPTGECSTTDSADSIKNLVVLRPILTQNPFKSWQKRKEWNMKKRVHFSEVLCTVRIIPSASLPLVDDELGSDGDENEMHLEAKNSLEKVMSRDKRKICIYK